MLSRSRLVLALSPALFAALACRVPDISDDLDDYQYLSDVTTSLRCNCPQDLGFQTTSECQDAYGHITVDERQCFADALDGSEAEAEEFLSCTNAALEEYEQCLAANVDCEAGVNDACESVYTVEASRCTQLPAGVQSAFMACTG